MSVFDNKCPKIWLHSDNNLPLKEELEMHGVVIIVFFFYDKNKHYPQVFLNECL